MTEVRIFNTMKGTVEPFAPRDSKAVKMYVCGVTPYDECHLGHARCYVSFDFIRRSLERMGYGVRYVQNFTDIDDKIIARAAELGEDPAALADRFIASYFDKMDKLGVRRADAYPRVTQSMDGIVALIRKLIERGAAYQVDGDVYFSVRRFESYGRLSGRSVDELLSGARVRVDERKSDPLDFALWKAAKPGEPSWPSPWGPGRPGWHIECSVMSLDAFGGNTVDLHGGGQDLIFPHHENEIAQSEAATGQQFVRHWMHNGFVTIKKEKMSKSLGNFFTLADVFRKHDPRAVRLMILSHHYRSPLEYSDELIEQAAASLRHVEENVSRVRAALRTQHGTDRQDDKVLEDRLASAVTQVAEALADDFNSPQALAALHGLLGELSARTATHKSVSTPTMEKALAAFVDGFENLIGIRLAADAPLAGASDDVESLVRRRETARKNKEWAEADRLRKELAERGVVLEDTSQGTRWWIKTPG